MFETAFAAAGRQSSGGSRAWEDKFRQNAVLRTGSSRAPEGYRFAQDDSVRRQDDRENARDDRAINF